MSDLKFQDTPTNRFDFDQQMMECWNVVKDIQTVAEFVGDEATYDAKSMDQIMNMLLGLAPLYDLKFAKLANMFEKLP